VSLLAKFELLDDQLKHALSDESSPLLLSLAALELAEREAGVQRLTAEHIVACLEAAGIAVKRKSVSRALARAGNKVSTSRDQQSGDTSYRLMTHGRREIDQLLTRNSLSVVRIEGGKPHTARQHLGELLASLAGIVRICDPYYGQRTLETLDHLPLTTTIRFLTSKTNESSLKVKGAFGDFSRERKNVEFRVLAPPNDLHDRYVLSQDSLLLVGHGLKDIGGKESFVVKIDRALTPDLLDTLIASFEAKWPTAAPL
jgi:hypothetical protein